MTAPTLRSSAAATAARPADHLADPADLADLAGSLARDPGHWLDRVRLNPQQRWYQRLRRDEAHEVWLISWLPGQSTGFHDHGGSRGAFAVALGSLVEEEPGVARTLHAGDVRAFGPDHVHHVHNTSIAPAISVHAYSPPLTVMNRYDLTDRGLIRLAPESADQW